MRNGSISYGIPLWYRIVTGIIILLVAGALFTSDTAPGIPGWIIFVLLLLGLLYEERWTADPATRILTHRGGIFPIIKATTIDFASIEGFVLGAFVQGTIPGSSEETADKERAFATMRGQDTDDGKLGTLKRLGRRKPFINLIIKTKEGASYLVDTLPARRAARLKKTGSLLATVCDCQLSEEA